VSFANYPFRPTVLFDVNNPEHRLWLGEFTKSRSWGKCPVKFATSGNGNTIAQMQLKLLQYYTDQEFNKA